ncbi:MAG: NfeD family protein [Lachnospiraceae bacterium]|nr:NfeD family protein [Lachnospiraceae bacterium]
MLNIIWLVLFAVLLVIEVATLALTTIWFALGALVAYIAQWLGAPFLVQIVVFVIVSIVLLLSTRPIAVKYFNKNRTQTNVYSLIGEKAVVIEAINTILAKGRVTVNGQEWAAKAETEDAAIIPKNTVVVISEVQGVKLIVHPI